MQQVVPLVSIRDCIPEFGILRLYPDYWNLKVYYKENPGISVFLIVGFRILKLCFEISRNYSESQCFLGKIPGFRILRLCPEIISQDFSESQCFERGKSWDF